MDLRRITILCLLLFSGLLSSRCVHSQLLMSHVETSLGPPSWSYTLFNDEPLGNPNFVTEFNLTVNAPILVTSTPAGWTYDTDNQSYVHWYNEDSVLPYPHDIAPGNSLGGFSLQSTADMSSMQNVSLFAWDHQNDLPGSVYAGFIPAPMASVPEPSGSLLLLCSLAGTGLLLQQRNSKRRPKAAIPLEA